MSVISALFGRKKSGPIQVGQKYVVVKHGMCQLKRIDTKTVGGHSKEYYVFQVVETKMTLLFPVDQLESMVRELVSKDQIVAALRFLADQDAVIVDQTTWNRRYREYCELLDTGSLRASCTVLRNLMVLRFNKDLSFGERKMLDRAKLQVTYEVASVLNLRNEEAEVIVGKAMAGTEVYV
jgi:CarD family transcriptional regulator